MRPAYNIKNEGPDDWKTFIANDQFNDLLRKTVSAVRNNDADSHKAIWVAGTYGSGKSHAGAVLKHLLCDRVEDIADYVNEEYGEEKYALLRNSIMQLRESKRLFPVNLYGQQSIAHEADLSLQVQKEVIRALKDADIKLTVQTDFDNYIQHIENEPDLWRMLIENNEVLKSVAPDLNKLKSRLANGDTEVLNRVTQALRNMGINVPIKNSNLKTWLFEVQNELRSQGTYDGLLIIWDEFTDVMRSDLGVPLLKILQEIAEDMMNPRTIPTSCSFRIHRHSTRSRKRSASRPEVATIMSSTTWNPCRPFALCRRNLWWLTKPFTISDRSSSAPCMMDYSQPLPRHPQTPSKPRETCATSSPCIHPQPTLPPTLPERQVRQAEVCLSSWLATV